MGKELNCKIVQDLMQSYLDDVINEYTKEQIEEHMKGCKECSDYCNKLKHYEKLRADDAEYMRAYQRKMKKWMGIASVSILLVVFILLFLFIPRKATFSGFYIENITTDVGLTTEVNVTYTYSIGLEFFEKLYGKIVAKDSYQETMFEYKFKNEHFFPATDDNMCFDWATFMYYSTEKNEMEQANIYIDEAKENLWIVADEFEIKACDEEFRLKVWEFVN